MMIMAMLAALVPAETPPGAALPEAHRALICAAAADGDPVLARRVAGLVARTDPAMAAAASALGHAVEADGRCPDMAVAPSASQSPASVLSSPVSSSVPQSAVKPGQASATGGSAKAGGRPSAAARAAGQTPAQAPVLKGQLEFGLGQTTGNTDTAAANIAASLASDVDGWKQKLSGALDYQRIEGFAANERYIAAYDVRRDLSAAAFISGLVSLESDRRSGFASRSTQSLGFGAKLALGQDLSLDLSGGPSLRRTDWVGERGDERMFGARGSAALNWAISPGFSFAASTSGIFEAESGTIEGQASITGKLIGPLATRLQVSARHETNAYPGMTPTTTSSRASIVYSF
ncbi:DUF481 domain-containing protein [Sphingomonas colocasiae]|uniref:DUF481 domain-containing protein n=1 Tax=Sphingomonas colocasiae TaxID=1848973 RepID=A0ABS7PPN7_9SPHN|nr:DUF481 domain-containing protein [Sphingomonas colocasiae]MBY8823280.1 DUF481 domain-containing protein [Sphingomonas colocasiae]